MRIIQTNQKIYSSMYLSMPNANIFSQLANEKKFYILKKTFGRTS